MKTSDMPNLNTSTKNRLVNIVSYLSKEQYKQGGRMSPGKSPNKQNTPKSSTKINSSVGGGKSNPFNFQDPPKHDYFQDPNYAGSNVNNSYHGGHKPMRANDYFPDDDDRDMTDFNNFMQNRNSSNPNNPGSMNTSNINNINNNNNL
mmetsp:Transcript_22237/g.19074  ORF Transcript_22237/g.19074 Transcript_22237/m.19074 type:complete len:147 (-) Transcript_22237:650-1090(-)